MIVCINTALAPFFLTVGTETDHCTRVLSTRAFTENLSTYCLQMLSELGASWSDVRGVGVVQGPGSYTGIRIGVSVAKSMAQTLSIPCYGFDTFDLLHAPYDHVPGIRLVVFPSRKAESNVRLYKSDGHSSEALTGPVTLSDEALLAQCGQFEASFHLIGQVSDVLCQSLRSQHIIQGCDINPEQLFNKTYRRLLQAESTGHYRDVVPLYSHKVV